MTYKEFIDVVSRRWRTLGLADMRCALSIHCAPQLVNHTSNFPPLSEEQPYLD